VLRVACCALRRSTPLKSIFYVRRARNRARSKGGEGRFFHRFIFLLLFVVSRSKVTPPHFPSARIVDFQNIVSFNANMSVYLYMLIFSPLKGLPFNTFENYGMAS
jgi:hypothetical protein